MGLANLVDIMTWKPRHEAHAIDRVRVQFAFREPLTSKLLTLATSEILQAASSLGFGSVEPIDSGMATLSLLPNASGMQNSVVKNGVGMKRYNNDEAVEEVAYRDILFGYLTQTYGRWENLLSRLNEVMVPALRRIEYGFDLGSVKLEYWDSFIFDGEPSNADINQLLDKFDTSIPQATLRGETSWHSHIGWFEGETLINRNLDVVDQPMGDGSLMRVLGIYTMVEQRSSTNPISMDRIESTLEDIHKRSLLLFGQTINEGYRQKIGLNLGDYQ